MGKPFRCGQSNLNDFVTRSAAQPNDESSSAGVVVRVTPIGMVRHTIQVAVARKKVQRGVLIHQIHFLMEICKHRGMWQGILNPVEKLRGHFVLKFAGELRAVLRQIENVDGLLAFSINQCNFYVATKSG